MMKIEVSLATATGIFDLTVKHALDRIGLGRMVSRPTDHRG